ncbi:CLUMA_CG009686, isoform A [Clunio marinus]|uniref:Anion exchange protein n=1 Tax=Clunio marinus TaxID=568069 RepID=A0A1J1I7J9_9DIPT|nr:CLUMA_CG009686, isoform A [Clunio marinus]
MSRDEKRKMSFIPIVRQTSRESEGEDLLNQEIDDLLQSDFEERRLSENFSRNNRNEESSRVLKDDDCIGENVALLEKVLEDPKDDKNSENSRNEGNAMKARMSDILGEISEDENTEILPKQQRDNQKRKKHSLSPFPDSNNSINTKSEIESKFNHTPHDLFIQLNELCFEQEFQEWRETARWIKYEENVEEGADRWGRPHMSSLSFHSLLNLRLCLEKCAIMLDVEEKDIGVIIYQAVETMFNEGIIRNGDREKIFRTILLHHNYEHRRSIFNFGVKKKSSHDSSQSLVSHTSEKSDDSNIFKPSKRKSSGSFKKFSRRGSTVVFHPRRTSNLFTPEAAIREEVEKMTFDPISKPVSNPATFKVEMENDDERVTEEEQLVQNEYVLKRLPINCEGAAILAAVVDFLDHPTAVFIRLAESTKIANVLEVSLPVRFLFFIMGPKTEQLDYHEIGRSISTLLSNKHFRNCAYATKTRKSLIKAIDDFLNESIVFPPGKLDKEALLSFENLKKKSEMIRARKRRVLYENLKSQDRMLSEDQIKLLSAMYDASQKKPTSSLQRTGKLWGGLRNDLSRRLPMFKSDIIDGLNFETLAATVFMYFACFATAITFGGLAGDLTNGWIGISETLLSASFAGIVFHIFGGQPLVIIGTTGPLILFDKALVSFCTIQKFDFLNVRVYVGFWMLIISLLVSAFEGSVLVRYFTRFTQEIFSALITLIYLYSTFNKTMSIYKRNPLMEVKDYVKVFNTTEEAFVTQGIVNQPNTALFCTLLTLGTFVLAYNLKIFRNSKFLGRTSRRALGDFGVPISIAIFVIIANYMSQVETEKLNVPDGIEPTVKREWLVPLWIENNPMWLPFACVVPGFLIYILTFMESHISELILDKPERKLKKGSGFHWDIVLLCILNSILGLFGMPWHCAAAVRSVAHISAVTIMSTNHPPGESPHIVGVKEQRLSGFFVSLLIGLSIYASPILKKIPISVLFGVFLYMGVCSMNGVQLFERIILFFVPVKYHTGAYATKLLTYRMHIYTVIQVTALAILWIVNESPISLAFPFFLIMMVPLRKLLDNFYSPSELEALDGSQQNENDDIDDDDFYEQTHISA